MKKLNDQETRVVWMVHDSEVRQVRAYPSEYTHNPNFTGFGVWFVDGIGNVHEREFYATREEALDARITELKDVLAKLLSALGKLDAQRSERPNAKLSDAGGQP